MQRDTVNHGELSGRERWCQHCEKTKSLSAFSLRRGRNCEPGKICLECEQLKQYERHCRVTAQREIWQQQEREERRQKTWERRVALRQIHAERDREQELWHRQQPDRCCCMCRQVLPASEFGGHSSRNGFTLYTRCKTCHEAMLESRQLLCCLCHRRTSRRKFLSHIKGYALCGDGAAISLCCQACETAFLALSDAQQSLYIRTCCQRAFPDGQVIYAEVDPETREIRYVGRTGKPKRRHAQHLSDRSPREGQWGPERTTWYTRRNWMQALAEKGLTPSMEILQVVESAPLVLEWEQRFIFHGIQQGWNLLNWETMDNELVARARAASVDFFTNPFEMLVQQHFFASHGLVAFLHKWCQPERIEGCPPDLPYGPYPLYCSRLVAGSTSNEISNVKP